MSFKIGDCHGVAGMKPFGARSNGSGKNPRVKTTYSVILAFLKADDRI
jgi:hypothetical protein